MVRRARLLLAGVLFAASSLPLGLMIVWPLAWGSITGRAAVDLGALALLCGMTGWMVMPSRKPPMVRLLENYQRQADAPAPSGRLSKARRERLDLEVAWLLPAYTPPHELPEQRVLEKRGPWWQWWDDRGQDGGELGDRDW